MSQVFTAIGFGSAPLELLKDRRGPAERPLLVVDGSGAASLMWDGLPASIESPTLHLTIAMELGVRHRSTLSLYIDDDPEPLATREFWCIDPYQRVAIPLPADRMRSRERFRLTLRTNAGDLFSFFAPDAAAIGGLETHLPRISTGKTSPGDFCEALCSLASLQTFSWKEGCVLDGLEALHATGKYPAARPTMRAHLDYFGFSRGTLVYETPSNHRVVDRLTTIEATLSIAHVAMIDPNHPWIDMAMRFWHELLEKFGQVHDSQMISAEGAYTVTYPLAVIGRVRNDPACTRQAESLLCETFERLVQPDGIYLRHFDDDRRTLKNWARGIAWLLLGHVQTMRQSQGTSDRLLAQLRTLAAHATRYQLDSGLWGTYVDEPAIAPDTAGTAGIAAALRIGAKLGYLNADAEFSASRAGIALLDWITPDGFLDGCSQTNKAGEDLQRSEYRVVTPYATGLFAMLHAAG